jgi:hypothetical protein
VHTKYLLITIFVSFGGQSYNPGSGLAYITLSFRTVHTSSVQEQLQWLGAGVEREVDSGLDPAYLLAVRPCHSKLRESISHEAQQTAAMAKK